MKPSLFLILTAYYCLHQDFWNWTSARPLIFGFIPIGLMYHVLYAAGAAALMAILIRKAWPERLEEWANQEPEA
jgi:hypothetical protein